MQRSITKKLIAIAGFFVLAWLAIRYILPCTMPFLLGAGLALAAEPAVGLCSRKLGLRRGFAAGIGVSSTLILLLSILFLLGSVLVREVGQLSAALPNIADMAVEAFSMLQNMLLNLAQRSPDGIRPVLTQLVQELLGSGSAFLTQGARYLSGLAGNFLSHVPGGALTLATAVISAFMISARLPKLKDFIARHIPDSLRQRYAPALTAVRSALGGWLKAQCKLSVVSFLIITLGLVILKVPYAPVWGGLIALVDAFPLLGTGAVMVPWALISLLQGDTVFAIGLIGIYAAAALTRSVLEPRLVGQHLGLDPLVTLVALYAGYRFFGLFGMLLSPMLAVIAAQILRSTKSL